MQVVKHSHNSVDSRKKGLLSGNFSNTILKKCTFFFSKRSTALIKGHTCTLFTKNIELVCLESARICDISPRSFHGTRELKKGPPGASERFKRDTQV